MTEEHGSIRLLTDLFLKPDCIGCGGRGSGAAINFLNAGPNLQITALGDTFKDRLDQCREGILKEKGQEVPEEKCFVGFDAYQKVIDSGVDIILTSYTSILPSGAFWQLLLQHANIFLLKNRFALILLVQGQLWQLH